MEVCWQEGFSLGLSESIATSGKAKIVLFGMTSLTCKSVIEAGRHL